ncbi:TetR/AcrR family transcriptional regulator [Streptomyces sp. NBC_01142]|uniref:TetR/AcrR family transcriptional regulator n=1 Tax=Streptomyces sp. NBC_01142 TaxID=2975865 RepID=UPI002252433E|nr:TetR/AcrR family transcriptional regulator [Streptomyces sp. NBC_01142]MCX4819422.1 TetR/AcrR family transcriptional regulator [Streptomyces sp. NBC_01142]
MAEGLRERKKRRTRQHISDVATGLFVERGFDVVTIAEIAEAADVSVNTVYNYFPAKEDLFLDRSAGIVDRLSRYVRGRGAGESAADAVLRELREQVEAVSPTVGLHAGYDSFLKVIHGAHTLRSRLWHIQHEARENIEETLREETGAAPGDTLPTLVAGQLSWVQDTLMACIGRAMVVGRSPEEVSREALVLLDDMEELLGERVLKYAVREA